MRPSRFPLSGNDTLSPTYDPTISLTTEPTYQPTFPLTTELAYDPTFDPTDDPTGDPMINQTSNPTTVSPTAPSLQPTTSQPSELTQSPTTFAPTSSPTHAPICGSRVTGRLEGSNPTDYHYLTLDHWYQNITFDSSGSDLDIYLRFQTASGVTISGEVGILTVDNINPGYYRISISGYISNYGLWTLAITYSEPMGHCGPSIQPTDYISTQFLVGSSAMTWNEAENYCSSQGSNLVTIVNASTYDYLKSLCRSNPAGGATGCWIGLHYEASSWSWSDGSILTFGFNPDASPTNGVYPWGQGEPNNANEDCVNLFVGQSLTWNDAPCNNLNVPICNPILSITASPTAPSLQPTTSQPTQQTISPTTFAPTSLTVSPTQSPTTAQSLLLTAIYQYATSIDYPDDSLPTGWNHPVEYINIGNEGLVGHLHKQLTVYSQYDSVKLITGIQVSSIGKYFSIEYSEDGNIWTSLNGTFTGNDPCCYNSNPATTTIQTFINPFYALWTRMNWADTNVSPNKINAQFVGFAATMSPTAPPSQPTTSQPTQATMSPTTFAPTSLTLSPTSSPTDAICGLTLTGDTTQRYDVDYHNFTLIDSYQNITFNSCGSGYDTYLYFQTSSGSTISECDDCGYCAVDDTQTILTVSNINPGDYRIGIGG